MVISAEERKKEGMRNTQEAPTIQVLFFKLGGRNIETSYAFLPGMSHKLY